MYKNSKRRFHKSVVIMGDSGYLGMQNFHKNCLILKRRKNKQFSIEKTKKFNSKLAKRRVKIEHTFSFIKNFKIFSTKYRNSISSFSQNMNLVCGLYNQIKG